MADSAADADGAFHLAHRDFCLDHLLDQFQQDQRVAFVVFERALECRDQRELADFHTGRALEAHAVALGLVFSVGEHWLQLERHPVATAQNIDVNNLIFGFLQFIDEGIDYTNGLAVDGNDLVAFFQAGFGGRHAGVYVSDDNRLLRAPSGRANLGTRDRLRNNGLLKDLATAIDRDREPLVRAQHDFQADLLPCRVLDTGNARDVVTRLQSDLCGCRGWLYVGDHAWLVNKSRVFIVDHVDHSEQTDGEHDVHEQASYGDDEALPARVREK